MKINETRLEEHEKKLMEHILTCYPDKNELNSLLMAIHMAYLFDKEETNDAFDLPIAPELVSSLATLSITLLKEDRSKEYPFLPVIILRTFLASLVVSYNENKFNLVKGDMCLGKFLIPSWFAIYAQTMES